MFLPDKAVKEFNEIYKRKFGVELSEGEARLRAENFVRLLKLITDPITKKDENDQ
jgi:hypothetical protein